MSSDTITNFISPTKDVMAWVKSTLVADSSWTAVKIYEGQNYQDLFNFLPTLCAPACVVVYKSSTYQNEPRRILRFSVVVITKEYTNHEEAQKTAFDLLDRAISLLDHEIYNNHGLCRVVSDAWITFEGTGLTAYEVTFTVEDY